MSGRFVTLGDGTRVPLCVYVRAWKRAKELPPDAWVGKCPDGWGGSAGHALKLFRRGMHDRINRHIPGHGIGRKWSDDWYFLTLRFAHEVNTPRLIVRWAPKEFAARLAERLELAA